MNKKSDRAESFSDEIVNCRVEDIGLDGFAECLDVGPKSCPYALPFGYAFLCQHPRLAAKAQKTQKQKTAPSDGA